MMKIPTKLIALLSGAALLTASGHADSVSTDPVGYRQDTLPAGNTPYAPSFVHGNSYTGIIAGLVESDGNTTVTISSGNMDLGSFDQGAVYPAYYLEITEPGADQGYVFDVVSNTDDDVVVVGLLSSGFSLSGDEQVAIRKHMTIKDVFESAESSLSAFSDSVKLFNDDGSTTSLFWDGLKWTPDFVVDASLRPIYPGNGFLTVFGGSVDVTLTGSVKTTATKVPVYAGVLNFVSSIAPSGTTVGNLNMLPLLVPFSENIKILNQDGALSEDASYFSDGIKLTVDFSQDNSSDNIVGSNAFLLNVSTDKYWTVPAAYSAL